jgi:hypothetical protein
VRNQPEVKVRNQPEVKVRNQPEVKVRNQPEVVMVRNQKDQTAKMPAKIRNLTSVLSASRTGVVTTRMLVLNSLREMLRKPWKPALELWKLAKMMVITRKLAVWLKNAKLLLMKLKLPSMPKLPFLLKVMDQQLPLQCKNHACKSAVKVTRTPMSADPASRTGAKPTNSHASKCFVKT